MKTLIKKVALNFSSTVLPLSIGLWAIPLLIELIGLERFGLLSIAWMIVGYFGLLDMGLGRALTQQKPMLAHLEQSLHRQLVFAPWVDYEKRFHYWSAMDLALVWAADNYENDYASRTRNFDCLSLGLPIVQNHDAEWSARLQSSEAGFVTTADQLANLLLTLSQQPESLQSYRQRMLTNLLPEFAWPRIARQLLGISQQLPRLTLVRRLFGSFIFLATLPVWLLLLLTEMCQRISSLWKKN